MMTHNEIKRRYAGVQTFLTDGCYFLALMSIAEEVSGSPIDLLSAIALCRAEGWVTDDAYVNNPTAILHAFTGKRWTHKESTSLPDTVPDNMYTIQKWERGTTTHFRRRYVDTLKDSVTVKLGTIHSYYLFTCHDNP